MPKYKVLLTRMVEMVAEVEIEANNPRDAIKDVLDNDPGVTTTWTESDWCEDANCYAVHDDTGKQVYDWNVHFPPY